MLAPDMIGCFFALLINEGRVRQRGALLNKSEPADRIVPAGKIGSAIRTLWGIPNNVIRFSALIIAIASPTCAS